MKIIAFLVFFGASVSLSQPHIEQGNINPPLPQNPPQGWYKQNSTAVGNSGGIFFLNRDTGWVSFSDGLISTSNGGATWIMVYPFPAYFPHFVDALNGWAVGDTSLLRTADGGKNWQPVHSPVLGRLQAFGMDTIYTYLGIKPAFARSDDAGKTWKWQDAGLTHAQVGGMSFADAKHGFLCGQKVQWFGNPPPSKGTVGAGFMTTSDGGITWHDKYCPIQEDLHAIFAVDSLHLYVAGFTNIFYSSDGGITWKQKLDQGGNTTTFYFFNAAMGYAVGGSEKIYFTSDTGATWMVQNSGVSSYLNSVIFVDSLTGWACGYQGVIIHTINGGKSSVRQFLPTPVEMSVSPEPFAQRTTITYSLLEPSKATIHIYDVTGRELQVIESPGIQEAGKHTIEFDASAYPSGAFYYRLEAQGVYGSGKMTKIAQ
jgi:photosystem II stability/assembly factor-like uncharacterized protein